MRDLRLGVLLPLLLLALAFPGGAFASTPAPPTQKTALLRALGAGGTPPRCLTARMSSADPSFAEVYFTGAWGAGKQVPRGCEKYGANGVTIFRLRAGHWHVVTAGSSFVTGGAAGSRTSRSRSSRTSPSAAR